ncbi:ACT domain-containing protein ACR4-like isoform X2 [Wolffia australiana]
MEDEYEKLVIRMNPPRVSVDNAASSTSTLIKVDSTNKHGSLLEVVQVLTDLNLTVTRAYISSDGEWFMDVFHVVDQDGKKLCDDAVIGRIKQSLGPRSARGSVGVQTAADRTSIELTGLDRPGLLSEIFAVLAELRCNVVAAEIWTHNSRMASVVHITDRATGQPIGDGPRLGQLKQRLRHVLRGGGDWRGAAAAAAPPSAHLARRLHQMMYADRDFASPGSDQGEPLVTVGSCPDKGYTVVTVRCRDRPKLLFDAVCTLTDMGYVVYHGTVFAEGPEAHQEFYIRHVDGAAASSEGERQRLARCLEAAIRRRSCEGMRLELRCEDRAGLLSDVTRIFRENGLAVTRAEVATRGSQAANVFYVTDAAGKRVRGEMVEAVRAAVGRAVLRVVDEGPGAAGETALSGRLSSLGSLVRLRSGKLLYSLGLIRSCS